MTNQTTLKNEILKDNHNSEKIFVNLQGDTATFETENRKKDAILFLEKYAWLPCTVRRTSKADFTNEAIIVNTVIDNQNIAVSFINDFKPKSKSKR